MEIIKTNIANLADDKKTLYRLTMGESISIQKMDDDALSESYPVHGYVLRKDVNSKNEAVEILSILTEYQGRSVVLSTVSATFKQEFFKMLDLFGSDDFTIRITTGNSKSGRRYMSCTLGD